MPDDEIRLLAQPCRLEESFPVQARRLAGEVGGAPRVIALGHIGRIFAAGVTGGNLLFQRKHARGAARRIAVAGLPKHGGNMRLVSRAQALHARAVALVKGAVGQAQSALQQVSHIARGVVQVLRHPQAKQVFRMKIGGVERIDIGAQALAQRTGQPCLVAYAIDLCQQGLDRRPAFRFDSRFIHPGTVKIADLARGGIRLWRRRQASDEADDALVGRVGKDGERAPAAAVGGNLRAAQPVAIHVVIEVVARQDFDGDSGSGAGGLAMRLGRQTGQRDAGQGEDDGSLDWRAGPGKTQTVHGDPFDENSQNHSLKSYLFWAREPSPNFLACGQKIGL